MTRRVLWLGIGALAGSGATVWARRRLDRLARQVRAGEMGGEVGALVDHGARAAAGHVRRSVDAGRRAARQRAHELRLLDGPGPGR